MARRRYRGRSPLRRFLTVLGIVALVLAGLAGSAVLFLRPYLIRTDGGWRIDMPFLNQFLYSPTPTPEDVPEPTPVVVVVSPHTPAPTPEDTPEPTPAFTGTRCAVYVSVPALRDESTRAALTALYTGERINALVIDMKDDLGSVFTEDTGAIAAISALRESGVYLIARLSVVPDDTITRQLAAYGIKHTSGVNWLGQGGRRYLNIYRPEVRGYLTDIVSACRELGFNEVLLDNLHFPIEGLLSAISYGEYAAVSREEGVETLVTELAAAAGDIPLSAVLLPATLATGFSAEGGQRLSFFEETFLNLYVHGSDFAPDDPYVAMVPLPSALASGSTQRELLDIALGHARNYLIIGETGVYPDDLFS